MGWSLISSPGGGGGGTSGGWGLISSPTQAAPSVGGWSFASEPVVSNSYPSGSFTSYNAGYGLPAYSPGTIGGAGLSFGPYGEGTFTPLDFPVTRPLRPG